MRKGIGTILSAGGAAVLVIGLAATSASATTRTSASAAALTWTVSPGGTFSGVQSGKFRLTDVTTGKSIACDNHAAGSFKSGTTLRGAGIGSLTGLTFTGCTSAGRAITLTAGDLPWALNAVSYDASVTSGTTTGTVTGIHLTIASKRCSATVDGTTATANDGQTQIHYHNSLAKLKIRTQDSNLHVYNVTGCAGVLKTGDAVTVSSAYLLNPAQTISQN